jgi:hypothetical protein
MITLAGTFLLGLPLGAAVLLGAVLAPTDPSSPRTSRWKTRRTATGCASA